MFIPTQAKTVKTKIKTAPCSKPMTKAINQALTVAKDIAVEVAPATPPAVFNTVAAKVATSTAQATSSAIAHLRKVGNFFFVGPLVESFISLLILDIFASRFVERRMTNMKIMLVIRRSLF